jgi:hypothetical protein
VRLIDPTPQPLNDGTGSRKRGLSFHGDQGVVSHRLNRQMVCENQAVGKKNGFVARRKFLICGHSQSDFFAGEARERTWREAYVVHLNHRCLVVCRNGGDIGIRDRLYGTFKNKWSVGLGVSHSNPPQETKDVLIKPV